MTGGGRVAAVSRGAYFQARRNGYFFELFALDLFYFVIVPSVDCQSVCFRRLRRLLSVRINGRTTCAMAGP